LSLYDISISKKFLYLQGHGNRILKEEKFFKNGKLYFKRESGGAFYMKEFIFSIKIWTD